MADSCAETTTAMTPPDTSPIGTDPSPTGARERRTGAAIHLLTASGAVAGFAALQAVIRGDIRASLLWLIVCQVLDGLDGPIARKFEVSTHAPNVDGHILDLIVDYVTCVIVPVELIFRLDLLPRDWILALSAAIILTSALWFSRTDQETSDDWFNGFPAAWNIVIPTFIILDVGKNWASAITIVLCAAQLTSVKIPHMTKVRAIRPLTMTIVVIYLADLTWLSAIYPNDPKWAMAILLIGPIYIAMISIWRTWFSRRSVFGLRIAS